MTIEERNVARMSEDLGTTIWRLRETVRVAKLAATHRPEQMRSLLMHERHKIWKREFGYDRIEIAAEMDEKCSRTSTSPVSNPFLYRNMVIPEHPHTPEEFHLRMKVDVEGLRMEIIFSQPSSSEGDTSPRRAAVDTGSEEPGTPTQSPAISKGSGPEAQQSETQMQGGIFPFEASTDGLLDKNITSTKQEEPALLCRQDVGVDDEEKETTSTQQAAVRKEFVSPTKKQRQRGTTAWGTEQHKLFDRGRLLRRNQFLKRELLPCVLCPLYCCLCFALFLSVCIFLSTARISYFSRFATEAGTKAIWCRMRELLHQRAFTISFFSPMKGIFCIQYLFVRSYFSLVTSVTKVS